MNKIDWEYLKLLVDRVPSNLNKNIKKQRVSDEVKKKIRKKHQCSLCGKLDKVGTDGNSILQIHHIIPNGKGTEENLEILCKYCHQVVHNLLFVTGKWRFTNVMKGIYPYGRGW